MTTLLALLLSMAAASAAENYFVLEADQTISNVIVANADFSPGDGKTKALVSSLPSRAAVGDKWNGSVLTKASPPPAPSSAGIRDFLAQFGYDEIALINLADIQARLKEASIELPTKAAAVREWITETQLAYAQGQSYTPAPYNYADVLAEVAPLLSHHEQ